MSYLARGSLIVASSCIFCVLDCSCELASLRFCHSLSRPVQIKASFAGCCRHAFGHAMLAVTAGRQPCCHEHWQQDCQGSCILQRLIYLYTPRAGVEQESISGCLDQAINIFFGCLTRKQKPLNSLSMCILGLFWCGCCLQVLCLLRHLCRSTHNTVYRRPWQDQHACSSTYSCSLPAIVAFTSFSLCWQSAASVSYNLSTWLTFWASSFPAKF